MSINLVATTFKRGVQERQFPKSNFSQRQRQSVIYQGPLPQRQDRWITLPRGYFSLRSNERRRIGGITPQNNTSGEVQQRIFSSTMKPVLARPCAIRHRRCLKMLMIVLYERAVFKLLPFIKILVLHLACFGKSSVLEQKGKTSQYQSVPDIARPPFR